MANNYQLCRRYAGARRAGTPGTRRRGELSLEQSRLPHAGEAEWSAAGVNYPVATGGSFWTDADSHAEIRIGPNIIGVATSTEFDVVKLNDQTTQIRIPQGRIYLHLRRLDEGHTVEIDIPRGSIALLQAGYYDIEAGSGDQPARVSVFEGSARFAGDGADINIKAGDAAVLNGSSPVTATLAKGGGARPASPKGGAGAAAHGAGGKGDKHG